MKITMYDMTVIVPNASKLSPSNYQVTLRTPSGNCVTLTPENDNPEIIIDTDETLPLPLLGGWAQQTIVEKMTATLKQVGKINAIREFRSATGAGLLEAKKFVEMYMPLPPQPTLTERVQSWLDAGNKTDAVREVQNATGCNLESAKAFVDSMLPKQLYENVYSGWLSDVIRLIRNNRFIDGLRLYRVNTSCTLREAKSACDQLRNAINDGKL